MNAIHRAATCLRVWTGLLAVILASIACNLTSQPPDARNPYWSPNGKYIAFECSFGGWEDPDYEICFSVANSSDANRLNQQFIIDWDGSHIAWSPNGEQFAFESTSALILASVPSGETTIIMQSNCWGPSWSPNGSQVACTLDGNIVIIDLQGKKSTLLVKGETDSLPTWSKDGHSIRFIRRVGQDNYALYTIELPSSKESLLVPNIPLDFSWSPDGDQIAYPSSTASGLEILNIASLSKQNPLQKYGNCFKYVSSPRWSHDGKRIALAAESDEPLDAEIWILDLPSQNVLQITDFRSDSIHVIGAPSWSPDDTVIATSYGKNIDEPILYYEKVPLTLPEPISCP